MKKTKNFHIHALNKNLTGNIYFHRATIEDKMADIKKSNEIILEHRKCIVNFIKVDLLNLIADESLKKLMNRKKFLETAINESFQLSLHEDKLITAEVTIKDSDFYACLGVKQEDGIQYVVRNLNKAWKNRAKISLSFRIDNENIQGFRFKLIYLQLQSKPKNNLAKSAVSSKELRDISKRAKNLIKQEKQIDSVYEFSGKSTYRPFNTKNKVV